MNEKKVYEFTGTATVTVTCTVEAETEEWARALVENGDCAWECDMVDGDVENIELSFGPEGDEEESDDE